MDGDTNPNDPDLPTPAAAAAADDESSLSLSLSPFPDPTTTAPPHPPNNPPEPQPTVAPPRRLGRRRRKNPTSTLPAGKSATIDPPYPWAGDRRAIVRSLRYLRSQRISHVGGEVLCSRCNGAYRMELDLEEKFGEVATYIAENVGKMKARAPVIWMSPARPTCRLCNEGNSVRPVMSEKKKAINWLFLFLGQMLGWCTLKHLKYYLKHTKIHRTGAKDRLLFSTYMDIFKQLQADG